MATKDQIDANLKNAQKSTGPRTPEGKAVVAQNATKHGLLANQAVISSEDPAQFDIHRDTWLDALQAYGPIESMLAERAVILSWRLKRAARVQIEATNALIVESDRPIHKLANSLLPAALRTPESPDQPDLTLGRIALKDYSNSAVLDRLLTYERRIEHSLFRTINEIYKLHLARDMQQSAALQADYRYQQLKRRSEPTTPIMLNKPNLNNRPEPVTPAQTNTYNEPAENTPKKTNPINPDSSTPYTTPSQPQAKNQWPENQKNRKIAPSRTKAHRGQT